jgi:sulfatase modifying factor 1
MLHYHSSLRRGLRHALRGLLLLACGCGSGHAAQPPAPAPAGMAWIPGGVFTMGSDKSPAKPNEGPAHRVRVHGFWMDRTPVTNDEFAAFVKATGYVTTAERTPDWTSLKVQLPPGTPEPPAGTLVPGALVFVGTSEPVDLEDYTKWWRYVPGASWKHPQGPGSSLAGLGDHPVVQVSYDDALAFAKWKHERLPTEAEWEFAARGGLKQATYAWGNTMAPHGRPMANVWDNSPEPFPVVDSKAADKPQTSRVGSFPPNGYGLFDMTGNVWQWVADWYRADAYAREVQHGVTVDPQGPADSYDPEDPDATPGAPKRVIRGGSFLCSQCYCMSYRPSARRGTDPESGMSHIGFRLVSNAARDSSSDTAQAAR